MRSMSLGMLLLAIWLIVWGVLAFLKPGFAYTVEVQAILAIAAGILLLLRK